MNEEVISNKKERSTDYVWLAGCILITAAATFLRFFALGLKPFHHDEGVNGYFLTNLFRDGVYKYDPANYHGPTLYYIALGFSELFGLETVPVRWSVAIFGVLTVVLALFLKRYIGRIGSLFAALFIALSPGMVYISRYFIHEMLFVFLGLAFVLCVVYFIERRAARPFAIGWAALLLLICFLPSSLTLANYIAGENTTALWTFRAAFILVESVLVFFVVRMLLAWNDGRPIYFLLASACVSLMFATKETAFITLGTMLIACVCVAVWRKLRPVPEPEAEHISDTHFTWTNFRGALGLGSDLPLILAAAGLVFLYLSVLFFSSFFTYPEGVRAAFEAYAIWSKTGSKDHTQNGMWAYVDWAMRAEAPIFILSAIGTFIAFIKARHRFAMFAGLWAFGLFAAYTIIPYKTPWLALSFLLPMCIIAGYAINEFAAAKNPGMRAFAALIGIAASAILAYQSYELNFVHYDDNDRPYIYAHTKREFLDLISEIERYAEKSGEGKETGVAIVSPDYWPMVWYLKDYKNAIFHAQITDAANAEMIVAKKDDQDDEVIEEYSANYHYAGTYSLRPGVELMLLVRKDLADSDAKEL